MAAAGSSWRTPDFRETAPLRPNVRRDARRDTLEKPPLPQFLPSQPPPPHLYSCPRPRARRWYHWWHSDNGWPDGGIPVHSSSPPSSLPCCPWRPRPQAVRRPRPCPPLERHRRSLCRPLAFPLVLESRHMEGENVDGVLSPVVGTNETRTSAGPGRADGQSIVWSPHSPGLSSSFARVRHGIPPPYPSLEHTYQAPPESRA